MVVFLWARRALNLDSGERDLGTVEVVGFLGWREIKAGDLKARILELRSLPHGYLRGVRWREDAVLVADCRGVCSKSKQVN